MKAPWKAENGSKEPEKAGVVKVISGDTTINQSLVSAGKMTRQRRRLTWTL